MKKPGKSQAVSSQQFAGVEIPHADKPLAIRYRPIGDLKPAPRNARTHSEQQVAQIAASIREFGWTNPVLLGEQDDVIAGHGRLEAAKLLGMAEVPTIVLAGLTPQQRRALVIADNKLALNSGWDDDLLRQELGELRDAGFDMLPIGFDATELAAILDVGPGKTDPDDAPPVEPVVVSQPGDVWLLGATVVCPRCRARQPVTAAHG